MSAINRHGLLILSQWAQWYSSSTLAIVCYRIRLPRSKPIAQWSPREAIPQWSLSERLKSVQRSQWAPNDRSRIFQWRSHFPPEGREISEKSVRDRWVSEEKENGVHWNTSPDTTDRPIGDPRSLQDLFRSPWQLTYIYILIPQRAITDFPSIHTETTCSWLWVIVERSDQCWIVQWSLNDLCQKVTVVLLGFTAMQE